ncbi:TraX family protein [Streptococcus sp. ZJ93]|uniref:TraX family protein n=1 Tax=Streptococcus handemini TaxID=3161188 RepID=UPI0032EB394D
MKTNPQLTGYQLKLLMAGIMVLDHIHQMFYYVGAPIWLTMVGRLVMPIFLFMCAEGYAHTRNRKQYAKRLYISFLLMNAASFVIMRILPLDEVILMNNVFGTMFLSVVAMYGVDLLREKKAASVLKGLGILLLPILSYGIPLISIMLGFVPGVFTSFILPSYFTVEGGVLCVALALAFYLLRGKSWAQYLALALVALVSTSFKFTNLFNSNIQWMMGFAILPLMFYNGQRGKGSKYFFYWFYPAHIYLLYVLSYLYHTYLM